MFDRKSYRNACDRLTLDAGKIEEMIVMSENQEKKTFRRPKRVALVAAALVAALGITASAAEIPAVKEFITTVFVTISANSNMTAGITIPSVNVEERDGRTILTVDGEETDVTDALAQNDEYRFEGDGFDVVVDENGVAVVTAYGTDGTVVSFSIQGTEDYTVYDIDTETEGKGLTDTDSGLLGHYEITTNPNGEMVIRDMGDQ